MARQVVDVADIEEELARIWGLVGELSEQLGNNRALVDQLKGRSTNVKGQAAHVGTGFPLRRFNLDISDEDFQTELEAFSSHLVIDNQQLQHENKQLNALLKEYEGTLETVMGKFRGVAHASQQHDLSLHSYYTSLLQTLQTAHSSAQLHDNTSLSLLLTRLSTLLRSALRSLGGEEVDVDLSGLLHLSIPIGSNLSDRSSSPSSPTRSASPDKKSSSSGTKSVIPRAPARPTPFSGYMPGTSGGYAGTEGQADWALEREMEILRLVEENKALREILAIAEESVAAQAVVEELQDEEAEQKPDPKDPERRKSSLTVQELEDGADKEAAQKEERAQQADSGEVEVGSGGDGRETDGLLHGEAHTPGTGLEGGGGLSEGQQRPGLSASVLGFTAETAPPEEAIDDSLETGPEA